MIEKLREDELIQDLVCKSSHPTIEDLRPIFDKYNIKTATDLWFLFDSVRELWLIEKRNVFSKD